MNDNVGWDDTMTSLDQAKFPHNQVLDYIPPSTVPWTFVSSEWDPTWQAACEFHEEIVLENLEATGNASFDDALDAFPAYRDTYDASWLNKSEFRVQTNFNGETNFTVQNVYTIKDMFIWFLIQSDPTIDNRLYTNKGTMQISISTLHARNFTVLVGNDATGSGETQWQPYGIIANASYTRVDCNITQKPGIPDGAQVPWLWTNNTYQMGEAYSGFWMVKLSERSNKDLIVTPPPPHELFRFYQAYMAATNTWVPHSYTRPVSVWMDTVQLSTACLVLVLFLVLIELWLTGRYLWFLRRNKKDLEKLCIPDGKIEWMVYNARLAEQSPAIPPTEGNKSPNNRDYFRRASFGNILNPEAGVSELARVYSKHALAVSRNPLTAASPTFAKTSQTKPPRILVQDNNEPNNEGNGYELVQVSSSVCLRHGNESAIVSDCGSSCFSAHANTIHQDDNMLKPEISRTSSVTKCKSPSTSDASSPQLGSQLTKREDDVDPIDPINLGGVAGEHTGEQRNND